MDGQTHIETIVQAKGSCIITYGFRFASFVIQFWGTSQDIPWRDMVFYTTLTHFRIKYLVLCKVYTDVGGIK